MTLFDPFFQFSGAEPVRVGAQKRDSRFIDLMCDRFWHVGKVTGWQAVRRNQLRVLSQRLKSTANYRSGTYAA